MTTQITTWEPQGITPKKAGKIVCSFLDSAATSFGRSTHHNSREDQQAAELQAHDKMLGLDRDLYTAFLMLPGVTDRSRQMGLRNLLSLPRTQDGILTGAQETSVLYALLRKIPPQRLLKIIDAFRFTDLDQGIVKANNARTRKLILRTLFNSKNFEFWCIKYRQKIRRALVHAWGNRRASIIKSILSKKAFSRNQKEWDILKSLIDKHVFLGFDGRREMIEMNRIYEDIGFALGVRDCTRPMLKAFEDAKTDLSAGAILPPEVLEGLRATYHPRTTKEEVVRLTTKAGSLTHGQKMTMQRQVEKAGAVMDFDPNQFDAIKLYIYAFERGMTKRIAKALEEKARKAAKEFPMEYEKIGILMDASRSMEGHGDQFLRPIATALSIRDMLQFAGKRFVTTYTGGGLLNPGSDQLVIPQGESSLSEGFIELLKESPDAVYIISDGYENSPAGRFAEVLVAVRSCRVETPIYHLNPVFAGEAEGVRSISPDILSMPAPKATALGLSFLRGMIETDPVPAINNLLRISLRSDSMRRALR